MTSSAIRDMQTAIRAAIDPALIPDLAFHSMFGGMAAYVHGRTFALLSSVGLALKLAPEVKADLLTEPGARPLQFEEGGVVFKQYAIVPEEIVSEPQKLNYWIEESTRYVATLPVKKRKGR
jgi:TfoX/Sxy family transcriptional regulator of competence genes